MSRALELYINAKAGGYHTLMMAEGRERWPLTFSSNSRLEMLVEAARMLAADHNLYHSVRIVEAKKKAEQFANSDMLKVLIASAAAPQKKDDGPIVYPQPDPLQYDPHKSHRAFESDRMLGRHLVA